jgi:hypothetical protein
MMGAKNAAGQQAQQHFWVEYFRLLFAFLTTLRG